MLMLRSDDVPYAADEERRKALLVSEGGGCVGAPFLTFVAASPVVRAAAVGRCVCEDVCISLPGYSLSTLELLANFVAGKQVNACHDEAMCLARLCDSLGIEHGMHLLLGYDVACNKKQVDCSTTDCDPLASTSPLRDEELPEIHPESNNSGMSSGQCFVIEENFRATDCDPPACSSSLIKTEWLEMCPESNDSNMATGQDDFTEAECDEILLNVTNEDQQLPEKSKACYKLEYKKFLDWKMENSVTDINEDTLVTFFQKLSEKNSSSTLWKKYSVLKNMLTLNDNVNISGFHRLLKFLKQQSVGYVPKKSLVFTADHVLTFIKEAPNDIHLLHKVVLVMLLYGGLRTEQLLNISVDDVVDKGTVIIVRIPDTKAGKVKEFLIEEEETGALQLVRQYKSVRPKDLPTKRFFLIYKGGRCNMTPVGKSTVASVPSIVARYLKLENAAEYRSMFAIYGVHWGHKRIS